MAKDADKAGAYRYVSNERNQKTFFHRLVKDEESLLKRYRRFPRNSGQHTTVDLSQVLTLDLAGVHMGNATVMNLTNSNMMVSNGRESVVQKVSEVSCGSFRTRMELVEFFRSEIDSSQLDDLIKDDGFVVIVMESLESDDVYSQGPKYSTFELRHGHLIDWYREKFNRNVNLYIVPKADLTNSSRGLFFDELGIRIELNAQMNTQFLKRKHYQCARDVYGQGIRFTADIAESEFDALFIALNGMTYVVDTDTGTKHKPGEMSRSMLTIWVTADGEETAQLEVPIHELMSGKEIDLPGIEGLVKIRAFTNRMAAEKYAKFIGGLEDENAKLKKRIEELKKEVDRERSAGFKEGSSKSNQSNMSKAANSLSWIESVVKIAKIVVNFGLKLCGIPFAIP